MRVDPNLQTHIHTLSDLYTRLQSLRQLPLALLKLPNSDPLSPSPQTLRGDFQQLKDISEIVCSKSAQAAFQAARDSLKADSTDLAANSRRENRKRRYADRQSRAMRRLPGTDARLLQSPLDRT